MSKKNLLLVFGGRNTEHEVSLVSAANIAKALEGSRYHLHFVGITTTGEWHLLPQMAGLPKSLRTSNLPEGAKAVSLGLIDGRPQLIAAHSSERWPVDVAFPALHGNLGEDGTIQGLFRMMGLPFVGCDVLSSAISMDKDLMKRLLLHADLPTARYRLIRSDSAEAQPTFAELQSDLGTPLFLKPANAGSSVGVHKVRSQEEFERGLKDAFKYDQKVIIEEAIGGRELEVAVMGAGSTAKASEAGEIHLNADFYSYQAKYVDPNGATFSIPADLISSQMAEIRELALACYSVMECEGLARVDFFLHPEKGLYINELNTLPGFTSISMYPKMWMASGFSYQGLVEELIEQAFQQEERRSKRLSHFAELGE